RGAYAAILMDCQMPEMDGFEATIAIRAREGAARHTPIIAVTAYAMPGDRERCLDSGMDDYLAKPLQIEALAATLERWLRAGAPTRLGAARAASGDPGEPPVLDRTVLGGLLRLGGDLVADAIEDFRAQVPGRLAELRQAAAHDDPDSLRKAAHALKGESLVL